MLPGHPAEYRSVSLIRNIRLGDHPEAAVLLGPFSFTELGNHARGWGRLAKPAGSYSLLPGVKPRENNLFVALPPLLAQAEKLVIEWVPTDVLADDNLREKLAIPAYWRNLMKEYVIKNPLAVFLRGLPDLTNNADGQPTVAPAQ